MNRMDYSSISDQSVEPTLTRHLSPDQKERLTLLLDRYLTALEKGAPPSIDELAKEDPELIEPLRSYVAGLQDLHQIAVGFVPQSVSEGESTDENCENVLGDFRLFEEIGRGGMGVVYRAQQISLDRRVAIKLLPFASVLDSRQIARFKNEAQAAASLHHPNIVPVYTVGSARGVHYFAMQYIDGQSFDEIIARQVECGIIPEVNATVLTGVQIAEALHSAHEFGVVHRDVKPSNIMLDRTGKVWVTDFGLARCQTDASLTKTGDVVGTMKYMSPEQARGESALVDGRTDVYSLGATLYEMLSLTSAFHGGDAPAILRHIDERTAPLLRKFRADIPHDLETVIAKAMAKTRDGRYETALEFANDLRRVLAGEPTIARPPTIVDRVSRWAMAHRIWVATSFAVTVLALLGFAVSTAMISAAKLESDANAVRAERSDALSRAAVDRLGAQMAELLADIPAADNVRRQLLQETLAYYQDFANQASDDPGLQHDLAITYGKIGSLQNEIGLMDSAIAALEKSMHLFLERSAAQPKDPSRLLELATSKNNLALALEQAGRYDDATHWYQGAIGIQEKLWKVDPENPAVRLSLSLSLSNFGLLLSKMEQFEPAEDSYRQSIKIAEGIEATQRTASMNRQLASTYENLSGLLAKHDPNRAVEYALTALKTQMKELSADRGNPKAASRVALTLNSLGTAQSESEDLDAAMDSFKQAIDIQTQLTQRWPQQMAYQRDLALMQNNFGLALARKQQFNEARDAFEQALTNQVLLLEVFENDAELQSTLGGVYNNLAFVHERLQATDDAMHAYRSAIDYQRRAYQAAPTVPRYREFLSKHYFNYGRLLRQAGSPAEATEVALQRRMLWPQDGERLASVADELLAVAAQMDPAQPHGAGNSLSKSDCVDHAVETMRQAMAAGYVPPDQVLNRPEYESLRDASRPSGT